MAAMCGMCARECRLLNRDGRQRAIRAAGIQYADALFSAVLIWQLSHSQNTKLNIATKRVIFKLNGESCGWPQMDGYARICTVSRNVAVTCATFTFHIDSLSHNQHDNLTRRYLRLDRPPNRSSYI